VAVWASPQKLKQYYYFESTTITWYFRKICINTGQLFALIAPHVEKWGRGQLSPLPTGFAAHANVSWSCLLSSARYICFVLG